MTCTIQATPAGRGDIPTCSLVCCIWTCYAWMMPTCYCVLPTCHALAMHPSLPPQLLHGVLLCCSSCMDFCPSMSMDTCWWQLCQNVQRCIGCTALWHNSGFVTGCMYTETYIWGKRTWDNEHNVWLRGLVDWGWLQLMHECISEVAGGGVAGRLCMFAKLKRAAGDVRQSDECVAWSTS